MPGKAGKKGSKAPARVSIIQTRKQRAASAKGGQAAEGDGGMQRQPPVPAQQAPRVTAGGGKYPVQCDTSMGSCIASSVLLGGNTPTGNIPMTGVGIPPLGIDVSSGSSQSREVYIPPMTDDPMTGVNIPPLGIDVMNMQSREVPNPPMTPNMQQGVGGAGLQGSGYHGSTVGMGVQGVGTPVYGLGQGSYQMGTGQGVAGLSSGVPTHSQPLWQPTSVMGNNNVPGYGVPSPHVNILPGHNLIGNPNHLVHVPSSPGVVASHTPNALVSITDRLGVHVTAAVKEKVWKGEFVEMGSFVDNHRFTEEQDDVLLISQAGDGRLQLKPKGKEIQKVLTIEKWTSAFVVFMSILLECHLSRAFELLKYMDCIRTIAYRFPGNGWVHYDRQFRLRMARDPAKSWASVDSELWLTCITSGSRQQGMSMGNTFGKGGTGFSQGTSTPGVMGMNRQGSGTCNLFNQGKCHFRFCKYSHACSNCGKGNHSAMTCYGQRQNGGYTFRNASPSTNNGGRFPSNSGFAGQGNNGNAGQGIRQAGRGQHTFNARGFGAQSNFPSKQ